MLLSESINEDLFLIMRKLEKARFDSQTFEDSLCNSYNFLGLRFICKIFFKKKIYSFPVVKMSVCPRKSFL